MKVRKPTLLVFQLPQLQSGLPHFCMFWVSDFGFVNVKLEGSVEVVGRQRTPLSGIILVRNDREGERADSPSFPAPMVNFSVPTSFLYVLGF